MLIDDPVKAVNLLFENIANGNVILSYDDAFQLSKDEYDWLSDRFLTYKTNPLTKDEYEKAFGYFLDGRIYGWIKGIMKA